MGTLSDAALRRPRRWRWRWLLLAILTLAVVAATTLLGSTSLSWSEIRTSPIGARVFWAIRVPRALTAAVAGAGLAIGGVVFQAIFRNPLAEPYTLGVASGASLAAAVGFLLGVRGAGPLGIPVLTLLALGGALGSVGVVGLISRFRPSQDLGRLLLGGICVAYVNSAGILLVFHVADETVTNAIVVWMMGSLGALRPRAPLEIAIVLVPAALLLVGMHRRLDLLGWGDDLAAARGVHVGGTRAAGLALAACVTAVIVANCGPIGFVGLMVPHLARGLVGVRTLPLLVGAAMLGAAFLAVCDSLARSLPVTELPVGVLTNLLGAFFFLYLLTRRDGLDSRRQNAGSTHV